MSEDAPATCVDTLEVDAAGEVGKRRNDPDERCVWRFEVGRVGRVEVLDCGRLGCTAGTSGSGCTSAGGLLARAERSASSAVVCFLVFLRNSLD